MHDITLLDGGLGQEITLRSGKAPKPLWSVAVMHEQPEIVEAVRRIAVRVKAGDIEPEQIDERTVADLLYTADLPDPDLIIRTAGEMRLSNFLLWQASYAEFWATPVLWPDMTEEVFGEAVRDFARRERRFGGLPHA